MDQLARQALVDRLQGHMKKASSNVRTAFVAEKDDYKVVLSSKDVKQYYKGTEVGSTKIAELDDDIIEFMSNSPEDAAHGMLEGFRSNFDAEAFVTEAEGKKTQKTAAHSTQSPDTLDMTTQKQFDEQKPSLHPRTDESYTSVTQKQLPEHGQRPGTYDQVTEGQFRDERTTFYGADRTAGDWKKEDRNTVTERQFEEGVGEYTDVGESDRGEMGSKFDGGVEAQWRIIGEKQLMELLKHHEWTEPLTTTEGPDQLKQQDGELSRLTAEVAGKIVKEALQAFGNTVLSVGVTPADLSATVRQLVSHPSKYPVLANVIKCYAGSDVEAIKKKVAKARYFGKTANTDRDYHSSLVADVIVRQLAAINYSPQFIVDGLVALAGSDDFECKIDKACECCMKGEQVEDGQKESSNVDVFRQVLSGSTDATNDAKHGSDDDGFYSYTGSLTEVNASLDKPEEFKTAATEFARKRVLIAAEKDIDIVPQSLDVNEDAGTYVVVFHDPTKKEAELQARAEARRNLLKEADTKEAQMGGAGGMPPAAGSEMGNPMAPPGGGDMGAPPVGESLSQDPLMDQGPEGGTGEPQPPGTICPACGGEDVDVDNGEFRCNHCGAEGDVSIDMHVKKWPGTIEETGDEEQEGFGLGAEDELGGGDMGLGGGEPMGEGAGTTLPNVPVGASVKDVLTKTASKPKRTVYASSFRITPRVLETLKTQKIQIGSICPNCGSNRTDTVKSAKLGNEGICWGCGQEYRFRVVANKGQKNKVYGQYIWLPKTADADCDGCNRMRDAFNTALKEYGITREEFDDLGDITAQAPFVLKMAQSGVLNNLPAAMQAELPLNKIAASARWSGSDKFDKFPSASCMERLARRFGENATAMSGPCEGKNLAKCVCTQLEGLGIYSDGVAAKVAKTLLDKNPMVNSPIKTCIAMLVRDGFDMDDACVACDGLRAAHADMEDLMIEAIAQFDPMARPMAPKPMVPKPMLGAPKPMAAPTDMMRSKPMPNAGPKSMEMPGAPGGMPEMEVAPAKPMMQPMSAPAEQSQPMGQPTMAPTMDPAKPMDGLAQPMDAPVTDATDIGGDLEMDGGLLGPDGEGMGGELEVEFGGDFGGEGLDVGFEDAITIQLPPEAVDALQVLFDALQGQIGDELIEEAPVDNDLDMGDVTEDTVDDNDSDGGMPGLADDDSTPEGDFGGEEESEDSDEKPVFEKQTNDKDCGAKPCGKPAAKPMATESKPAIMESKPMQMRNNQSVSPVAESEEEEVKTAQSNLEDMLSSMKRGSIRTTQSALDNLFDGLMCQAEIAKEAAENDVKKMEYKGNDAGAKMKATPAQDSTDVKYKDGGKIGHESAFTDGVESSPDVPRAAATLGDEDSSNTVSESGDLPTVPHGSPAMAGEKNFRPEKGNVVDGNQSSQTTASVKKNTKTAGGCGCPADCKCKPCKGDCPCKAGEKNMKSASVWTVPKGHQHYDALQKKADAGDLTVKLQDNKTYDMSRDQNGHFVLIAQKIKKESQTVTPNKVDSLVDDPDINQSSGPGKGKTHTDETHSLAVTEKKPSEGMDEPSVPEAENKGQLTREHTYDNELNGPEIPAGGGMNPDYDENEKNTPEKLDQMLGKQDGGAAEASTNEAVKIAGQMVKANLITIDELPAKVQELSRLHAGALRDYEKLIRAASGNKGLQKEASSGAVETDVIIQKTAASENPTLKDDIQSLFRLDATNRDHENWMQDRGNTRLFH